MKKLAASALLLLLSAGSLWAQSLAAAKQNGKWGYITLQGEWAIRPQFDAAQSFSGGLAAVKVDGKWGYINAQGSFVITPQFEEALPFAGQPLLVSTQHTQSVTTQQSDTSVSIHAMNLTGEGVFAVNDLSGTLSYDKGMQKYVIRKAQKGTIDNVDVYILNGRNLIVRIGEGQQIGVTVTGKAKPSDYRPKAQVGGVKYYDLVVQSISITQ